MPNQSLAPNLKILSNEFYTETEKMLRKTQLLVNYYYKDNKKTSHLGEFSNLKKDMRELKGLDEKFKENINKTGFHRY